MTPYANQYAAGGDRALIDQLRGGINFRTGAWQGYQGDAMFIIDVLKERHISSVSMGCLQDIKSWIWLPSSIELLGSSNGQDFRHIATIEHNEPLDKYGAFKKEFSYTLNGKQSYRYLKVVAKNIGVCPAWHLGAGGKAWVFTDEFSVQFGDQ